MTNPLLDPFIALEARTMVLEELDSLELFAHSEDGLGHLLAQQMAGASGWTARAVACLNLGHLLPEMVLCEERSEAELTFLTELAREGSVDAAVLLSLECWRWAHTTAPLTKPAAIAAEIMGAEILELFATTAVAREEFEAAARLRELVG